MNREEQRTRNLTAIKTEIAAIHAMFAPGYVKPAPVLTEYQVRRAEMLQAARDARVAAYNTPLPNEVPNA